MRGRAGGDVKICIDLRRKLGCWRNLCGDCIVAAAASWRAVVRECGGFKVSAGCRALWISEARRYMGWSESCGGRAAPAAGRPL